LIDCFDQTADFPMDNSTIHRRWQWWHVVLPATIVMLALAPFDVAIAQLMYVHYPSRAAVRVIEVAANIAGSGWGVLILAAAAVLVDSQRWTRLSLLLTSSLGAGILVDLAKLCVSRSRPHSIDLAAATFASTFNGLFPMFSAGSTGQSFPSGHTATAAGMAVALGMMYPRGRWLFASMALGVAASRVVVHAHFPTDVAAGLILGVIWAWMCHSSLCAPVFAWAEQKLKNTAQQFQNRRREKIAAKSQPNSPSATAGPSLNSSDQRNAA
jgi:membrane-associated phospholipid phosphatase